MKNEPRHTVRLAALNSVYNVYNIICSMLGQVLEISSSSEKTCSSFNEPKRLETYYYFHRHFVLYKQYLPLYVATIFEPRIA